MSNLNLIRMLLRRRPFVRVAARNRVDDSYLLHAGLASLFGEDDTPAKVPFSTFAHDDLRESGWHWGERDEFIPLLAYSDLDGAEIQKHIKKPELLAELEGRPKTGLVEGSTHAFRLRACPTVRTRRDREGKALGRSASRELDAYQHARIEEPEIPRDGAYIRWLEHKLAGSASLLSARLESHQTQRMVRRAGTKHRDVALPNAVLTGVLRVDDSVALGTALHRGIGRHRAFGFGMLLLRRM